jgi:hypothetical protein
MTMTTTMATVHRRHSAMIHIAPAIITRTRDLHHHPLFGTNTRVPEEEELITVNVDTSE